MIYRNTGEGITVDNKDFTIFKPIFCNENSDYEGLFGVITEIRTEEDIDTDNEGPDIYCNFQLPVAEKDRMQLLTRFGKLHGKASPLSIEEMNLEEVIMDPSMLEPIECNLNNSKTGYVVFELWSVDGCEGQEVSPVFTTELAAQYELQLRLQKMQVEDDFPNEWENVEPICETSGANFYRLFGTKSNNYYYLELNKVNVQI